VDLQFSGHTHDGQVFPLSLLTGYLFDISYGYEKRGSTNFYVSSGFALWGPPFRIGTCSEMVIFECSFAGR
jgi:predicted MPP superfamily phosphohydrolase